MSTKKKSTLRDVVKTDVDVGVDFKESQTEVKTLPSSKGDVKYENFVMENMCCRYLWCYFGYHGCLVARGLGIHCHYSNVLLYPAQPLLEFRPLVFKKVWRQINSRGYKLELVILWSQGVVLVTIYSESGLCDHLAVPGLLTTVLRYLSLISFDAGVFSTALGTANKRFVL